MADENENENGNENEAVDIEPIIRKIVQEENSSTNERLSKIEEALGPLGNLGETLEGLFKKNKPTTTKVDEDSLVAKVVEAIKGNSGSGGNDGGSDGGSTGATRTSTGRKPGPLSRFLGVG